MERAKAPDLRKCAVAAQTMLNAGIRFIPMPVLNDVDNNELAEEMKRRLDVIEKLASEAE